MVCGECARPFGLRERYSERFEGVAGENVVTLAVCDACASSPSIGTGADVFLDPLNGLESLGSTHDRPTPGNDLSGRRDQFPREISSGGNRGVRRTDSLELEPTRSVSHERSSLRLPAIERSLEESCPTSATAAAGPTWRSSSACPRRRSKWKTWTGFSAPTPCLPAWSNIRGLSR